MSGRIACRVACDSRGMGGAGIARLAGLEQLDEVLLARDDLNR